MAIGSVLVGVGLCGLALSVKLKRKERKSERDREPEVPTEPLVVARMDELPTQRRQTSETSTNLVNLAELTCTCEEYKARDHFEARDFRRACKHIRRAAAKHFQHAIPNDIGWAYVCPPPVVPIAAPAGVAIDDVHIEEHEDMTLAIGTNDRLPWLDVVVYQRDGQMGRYIYATNGECADPSPPPAHRDIVEALWLAGFVSAGAARHNYRADLG